MKPLTFILCIAATSMWLNGYSQEYSVDDFTEVPLPILESKELYALNNRPDHMFAVSLLDGKLKISKYAYSPTTEYTVPEGRILGVDQGEFGGGLYFKPYDTTLKQIYVNGQLRLRNIPGHPFLSGLMVLPTDPINKIIQGTFLIKPGNVKKLFKYKDRLYIMEGLAHRALAMVV